MSLSRKVLLGVVILLLLGGIGVAIAGDRALLFRATFIGKGTGAAEINAMEKFRQIVNIKDYGAICDGSTDAAPAIRNAITAAGIGGTVIIPGCPSTYLLNSFDSTTWQGLAFMFYPLEGQTIRADYGAQLKVAASALNTGAAPGGGNIFAILSLTHVTIEGVRIDMNGVNNLKPAPSSTFHPTYAFMIEGGSFNTIRRTETLNSPGLNAIFAAGCSRSNCADQVTIQDNTVRNGGTTIAGNTNQLDWSAIYSEATHSTILNNDILNDSYPSAAIPNSGGIEIHGNYAVVSGNQMDKTNPAFYIGSNVSGQDITDVVVTANVATNSFGGVNFFPVSLTDNFGRIVISSNTFMMRQFSGFSTPPVGIYMLRPTSTIFASGPGLLYDSEIADNVISSLTASTDNSTAIVLAQTKNLRVHDNMMSQLGSVCINMQGAPQGHIDAVLDANICKDFALTSPGGVRMAITIDSLGDRPPLRTSPTVVALHQWVRPTTNNNFTYDATTAGTTNGAEPTWPVVLGNTVTDGSVVWTARAAWPYNGIVMRNNVFSETTTQATYAGIYMTNDMTANPPMTFANITAGPNLTHGIGNIVLGAPASGYMDVTNNVLYNRSNLAAGSTSDDQSFDSVNTRTAGNAFIVKTNGVNMFRVGNDGRVYIETAHGLTYVTAAEFDISGNMSSGGAAAAIGLNSNQTLSGASDKIAAFLNNGTPKGYVDKDGRINQVGVTFANIGTGLTTNGTHTYCSDCTIANPCAGGGTGAFAKRLNGVWVCN